MKRGALHDAFLKAIVPDVTVCMGVRLLPFSIGHSLLLERLDSPFFSYSDSVRPTYESLLEAVAVCSRTFEDGQKLLNSKKARRKILAPHRRRSWYGFRDVRWLPSANVMYSHIYKSVLSPKVYKKNDEAEAGIMAVSPRVALLLVCMMNQLKMGFSEAVNFPMAAAHWLAATLAENSGKAGIVDPEFLQESKKNEALVRDRIAKGEFDFLKR